jgi:hypothetical protein
MESYVSSLVPPDWLQAVQALMVFSVVFSSISFLVFLGQLFTLSKVGLFYFTGLCQVFAGTVLDQNQFMAASYFVCVLTVYYFRGFVINLDKLLPHSLLIVVIDSYTFIL